MVGCLLANSAKESRAQTPERSIDDQLVQIAVKLYELEIQVPSVYMKAFKTGEEGEGLFARLFNDPIAVLELVIARNEKNVVARFHLAKAYLAKSSYGEGKWSRSLLAKAEEQFARVVSGAATNRTVPRHMLADARGALDEIKKLQGGQGELVD
jgi:hypothetical protein